METFRNETTETGDVTAIAYSDGTTGIAKYNCQEYAEDLRRMYYVVHFESMVA